MIEILNSNQNLIYKFKYIIYLYKILSECLIILILIIYLI
jgi:hypothetical protein